MAEREGFEPSVRKKRTTVFETAPFNHSGTSPIWQKFFKINGKLTNPQKIHAIKNPLQPEVNHDVYLKFSQYHHDFARVNPAALSVSKYILHCFRDNFNLFRI